MRAPLAVLLTLLATPMAAQAAPQLQLGEAWKLEPAAQIRPRLVLDSGLDFLDAGARRAVVSQRSRVGVRVIHGSGVELFASIQDVRLWGEETDTLNTFDAAGLDMHEAWALVPILDTFALKLGRQEIAVENHRLVGTVDWTQRARSFDGVRLLSKGFGFDLDLFYAKINQLYAYPDGHLPEARTLNADFGGAHLGFAPAEGHRLAALYLVDAKWHADSVRHTAGVFATGTLSGWGYTAEGYYQFGSLGAAQVSAFLAALRAGYTAEVRMRPAFAVWGEYLSGDGTAGGTFDTLYATNHKFYGEMDVFLNIPLHTAGLGLVDLGAGLSGSPVSGVRVLLDAHQFLTAEPDALGNTTLGTELDLKVVWGLGERVNVQGLYGVFVPDDAMRTVRGHPAGTPLAAEHFGYLTVDVTL